MSISNESGSFRPWVVSPGRFALSRFALVLWVGRFALIRWVVSPVSCFARELFRPFLLLLLLLFIIVVVVAVVVVVDIAIVDDADR